MSQVTISGAVSGLDTASLINQLVSVQTNQQTLLRTQQTAVQQRSSALTSLSSSVSGLSTLAADVAKTSDWTGATATSSSTSVTATATGTSSGSITFDVSKLAAAHSLISTSSVAGTSTQVVSGGSLTVTTGSGTPTAIDVGNGTLGEVVSAINSARTGVVAAAVRTAAGAYRLQVTSTSTGAASQFQLDGLDGFDGTAVLTQARDAELTVGSDPATSYTVTSASNTFGDLVPGLSFTVNKLEQNVTVSAAIDGSTVADKVAKLVDQANSILSTIAAGTTYNSTTKTPGIFAGESSVRALQQNLLNTVSSLAAPGVEVTVTGKMTFNRQKFLDAFATDPAKVAEAFGAKGSFAPAAGVGGTPVRLSNALKSARAGSFAVEVTTPAAREQWSLETGGDLSGRTTTLTRGGTSFAYTADPGLTLAQAASAFNTRAAAAGFGVTATVRDTALVLTADASGSGPGFSAVLDGTPGEQLSAGTDVKGTIDGQLTTGVGDQLALPTGTGGAVGLTLQVTATAADIAATGGALGNLTFTPGLAQRLVTLAGDATSTSGTLTSAQTGASADIKRFQAQIDAWDTRLTTYRTTLTRQFTAMETALAKLKSSSSAITNMLGSSSSTSTGTASTSGG